MSNADIRQEPSAQQQLQPNIAKRAEIDLSIEVVLLVVGGVFFLLFGVLLFLITWGMLPYSEASMYGLFVVLVSMQIITMGKTPFGDFLRSWFIVIIGLITAMIGTLAIFFPGYLSVEIRILAALIVFFTGALGLLQLFTARDKARIWMEGPRDPAAVDCRLCCCVWNRSSVGDYHVPSWHCPQSADSRDSRHL